MKTLKELCDYLNNNNLSISEMNELIESSNFVSQDSTCVAEDETHTLEYAEDCVTITYNKK